MALFNKKVPATQKPIQQPNTAPRQANQAPTRRPAPAPTPQPVVAPVAPVAAAPAPAPARPRPAHQHQALEPTKQTAPSPSGRNVLSSDVEIKGSIKFSNDLVVDGKIEGQVTSDGGSLTVGENAQLNAEIKTRSVVIYGKVYGNIEVTHNVELKANCELVGDIKAASLSIEPGAIFVGKSTVGTPTAAVKPAASKTDSSKPVTQQPIKPSQPVKVQQPNKPENKSNGKPEAKLQQPQLPKNAQQQKNQGNKSPQAIKRP